jgi:phage FluMu protein Com
MLRKGFRKKSTLGATVIAKCTKCQGLLLAAKTQKTKTCPYCGKTVNMIAAQKVASAPTAFVASEMLKILKNKKGFSE